MREHDGIVFTHGPIFGFFVPVGEIWQGEADHSG